VIAFRTTPTAPIRACRAGFDTPLEGLIEAI
jgi:hypothetical protein